MSECQKQTVNYRFDLQVGSGMSSIEEKMICKILPVLIALWHVYTCANHYLS